MSLTLPVFKSVAVDALIELASTMGLDQPVSASDRKDGTMILTNGGENATWVKVEVTDEGSEKCAVEFTAPWGSGGGSYETLLTNFLTARFLNVRRLTVDEVARA